VWPRGPWPANRFSVGAPANCRSRPVRKAAQPRRSARFAHFTVERVSQPDLEPPESECCHIDQTAVIGLSTPRVPAIRRNALNSTGSPTARVSTTAPTDDRMLAMPRFDEIGEAGGQYRVFPQRQAPWWSRIRHRPVPVRRCAAIQDVSPGSVAKGAHSGAAHGSASPVRGQQGRHVSPTEMVADPKSSPLGVFQSSCDIKGTGSPSGPSVPVWRPCLAASCCNTKIDKSSTGARHPTPRRRVPAATCGQRSITREHPAREIVRFRGTLPTRSQYCTQRGVRARRSSRPPPDFAALDGRPVKCVLEPPGSCRRRPTGNHHPDAAGSGDRGPDGSHLHPVPPRRGHRLKKPMPAVRRLAVGDAMLVRGRDRRSSRHPGCVKSGAAGSGAEPGARESTSTRRPSRAAKSGWAWSEPRRAETPVLGRAMARWAGPAEPTNLQLVCGVIEALTATSPAAPRRPRR